MCDNTPEHVTSSIPSMVQGVLTLTKQQQVTLVGKPLRWILSPGSYFRTLALYLTCSHNILYSLMAVFVPMPSDDRFTDSRQTVLLCHLASHWPRVDTSLSVSRRYALSTSVASYLADSGWSYSVLPQGTISGLHLSAPRLNDAIGLLDEIPGLMESYKLVSSFSWLPSFEHDSQ